MAADIEMKCNKIGSAIQYYRETYYISQGKLCKGLCSVATLSRIESGERDVDSLLLETLLERLGKTPNQFELILTDYDYMLYKDREEIEKQIEDKYFDNAFRLLCLYEKLSDLKGSVHKQFIIESKARINELQGGTVEKTLDLLMEAISYTVPDFKTNRITDYYLSNTELNIIINIIQRMISAGMIKDAKEVLFQALEYFDVHDLIEENNGVYLKLAITACRLLLQEKNLNKALSICNKGLDKNNSHKLDSLGELLLIKAQITEALMKNQNIWDEQEQECLKLYLQAFYVFDILEMIDTKDEIKKYLWEEYRWACTD